MKADDLVESARAAAESGNLTVAEALLKRATEIDPKNNGFGQPDDFKITDWDPYGNFSFTIPTDLLLPGKNTISIRAVDKAGLQITKPVDLVLQGPSDVVWSPQGPGRRERSSAAVRRAAVPPLAWSTTTTRRFRPRTPGLAAPGAGAASRGLWPAGTISNRSASSPAVCSPLASSRRISRRVGSERALKAWLKDMGKCGVRNSA